MQILFNLRAQMGRMSQTPKRRSCRPQHFAGENCPRTSEPKPTGVSPEDQCQNSLPKMRVRRPLIKILPRPDTNTSAFGSVPYNKQTTTENRVFRRDFRRAQHGYKQANGMTTQTYPEEDSAVSNNYYQQEYNNDPSNESQNI